MTLLSHFFSSFWWLTIGHIVFFASITYVLFRYFKRLGTQAKSIDSASRWSAQAKPTVGGIVFFIAFIIALFPLFWENLWTLAWEKQSFLGFVFLVLAGVSAFLLGLWDDLKRIPAKKKLIGQLQVAVLFALSGHYMNFFDEQVLSGISSFATIAIVIFLVVAIMNSVNMIDNMDGIATIAALPAMALPFIFDCDETRIGFVMLTALIGFLFLNWTPAKVYMGDAGSMLLGLIVAWMILGSNSCGEISIEKNNGFTTLVILLGIGALFIVDSLVVVFNRIRHGVSPAQGGRDHTTHNLFYLGLKQWQIAILFLLLGLNQVFLVKNFIDQLRMDNNSSIFMKAAPVVFYFCLLLTAHLLISFRNLRLGKYSYSK